MTLYLEEGGLAQVDANGCDVHVMILLILTAEQNPTRRRTISLTPRLSPVPQVRVRSLNANLGTMNLEARTRVRMSEVAMPPAPPLPRSHRAIKAAVPTRRTTRAGWAPSFQTIWREPAQPHLLLNTRAGRLRPEGCGH